jgi:anionic cell wall polymer biosynthesis LytR-Cps2A-Psr (LCP) family protein
MKFLKKFLLLVFLLYLLLNIFIYFFQEKLIFFPIKISQNTKIENEVSFRTEDDIKLYGKFKDNNSEKVILFFAPPRRGGRD